MKYLYSFFLALAVSILVGLYFLYETEMPVYGKLDLKGLSNKVTVYRDENGVPHIKADNKLDAYRSLGFLQAGDRLFQMELLRRIGSGRLSEILGEELLQTDILLRSLRLRKTAKKLIEQRSHLWPDQLKAETKAFIEGINLYVETMPLPLEFKILGIKPEPFSLIDSVAISGYMALSFAEGLLIDPLHSDLKDELPKDQLDELFISTSQDKNLVSNNLDKQFYQSIRKSITVLEERFGLFHGSNSWVLSGKRSKSGKPLLCNDPHVAFSLPGIWYEAHIKTPSYELYGFYVPLSPYTPMGHNHDVGWAVTMAEVDDLDLYLEKIEKDKVLYKNKWVPVIKEEEVIKVKNNKDYIFTHYITPHGPTLDQTSFGLKDKSLSIAWSFHHPENDTVLALYNLSRAKNTQDFFKAVSFGASPGLNMSWVDSKGNIAWKIMAKIPIRPQGLSSKSLLEGWHGKHDYLGYLDSTENPGLLNPEEGYIATANYKPIYKGSHPMPGYYQASERYERIIKLIESKDRWSANQMKMMQTDQHVATSTWMVPILLENLKTNDPIEKKALKSLRSWGGDSQIDSLGSSIYHMTSVHIIKNLLIDELGDERYKSFSRTADIWHFYKAILKNENSKWWDNKKTKKKESMPDVIQLSFSEAVKHLSKLYGEDPNEWTWGKLHTIEYQHPFGKLKPLNLIFNRGPYPAGGGFFQIDNMSNSRSDFNFNVTLGPSTRRIIDFNDPQNSFNVVPTGNSGNIFSRFYDDQIETFLEKGYRPASLNWDWIKANSTKLELLP